MNKFSEGLLVAMLEDEETRSDALAALQWKFDNDAIKDGRFVLDTVNNLIRNDDTEFMDDLRLLSADLDEWLSEPAMDWNLEAPPRWAGN
jgi:hypothetical protein